jgi:hypothetical protein
MVIDVSFTYNDHSSIFVYVPCTINNEIIEKYKDQGGAIYGLFSLCHFVTVCTELNN